MQSSKWTDDNGSKRTSWELSAARVVFLGGKGERPQQKQEREEEIPF